jgi:ABC-type transporter MlaC component
MMRRLSGAFLLLTILVSFFCDLSRLEAAEAVVQKVQHSRKQATQDFIEKLGKEAISVLINPQLNRKQRFERFRKILTRDFSVEGIGKYLAGRYYDHATPKLQSQYFAVLTDYIAELYLQKFDEYTFDKFHTKDFKIIRTYPLDIDGKQVSWSIKSRVHLPHKPGTTDGGELNLEWRVFWVSSPDSKALQPRVFDVYVAGISMSRTKKDEFHSVLQDGGFPELIKRMKSTIPKADFGS